MHPLYLHFSFDDPITGEQFFFKVRASGQAISCALSYRSFPHRHSHTIVSNIILTMLKKIMDRLTGDCDTFCSSLRYFLKNKLKRRLFGALKHFDDPVLLQLFMQATKSVSQTAVTRRRTLSIYVDVSNRFGIQERLWTVRGFGVT